MIFSYQETQVSKKDYKGLLSKAVEEAVPGSVEVNLMDIYYKIIEQLLR